jgi:hypothetical protein
MLNISNLRGKIALWVVSALILLMVVSGLASSKMRLIYYRQKDSTVRWITENLYELSHQSAARDVRIVCLGDSMTDDMPEQPIVNRLLICRPTWIEMLERKLRATYPDQRIFAYNHGARSKKIATALERMENPYEREDFYYSRYVTMPSVSEMKPDIIILESHGYMDHDTDYEEYRKTLTEIVLLATERIGADVYLLVTICPDSTDLKKPYALYVNDAEKRIKEAQLIKRRLEDGIALGRSLGIPIIDVYHKTIMDPRPFIKEQDMVHPSYRGHVLIAEEAFNAVEKSSVFTQ